MKYRFDVKEINYGTIEVEANSLEEAQETVFLELVSRLAEACPLWHMTCTKDAQAAEVAHQVKACIAKCTHRMEHAEPYSPAPAVHRHKPERQYSRAHAFDHQRHQSVYAGQPRQSGQTGHGHGFP